METLDKKTELKELTDVAINELQSMAKWSNFMGIYYALVGLLFFIVVTFIAFTEGNFFGYWGYAICVVCSGYIFLLAYKILKSSKSINNAIKNDSQQDMEEGISSIKTFFKILGWSVAVCISLFLLWIVTLIVF